MRLGDWQPDSPLSKPLVQTSRLSIRTNQGTPTKGCSAPWLSRWLAGSRLALFVALALLQTLMLMFVFCRHPELPGTRLSKGAASACGSGASSHVFVPQPSLYSSYGSAGIPYDLNSNERSVRLHHVCLEHSSGEVVYYVDPSARGVLSGFDGRVQKSFPPDWVATATLPPWVLDDPGQPKEQRVAFSPKVVRGRIPSTAVYVNATEAPVHVLVSTNDFIEAFGHSVYNFLLPVFNLLHSFHMYTPSFQLLLHKHGGNGDQEALLSKFFPRDHPQRSLLRLVSSHDAMQLADVAVTDDDKTTHTCFHTLLVGTEHQNAAIQRVTSSELRAAALRHLGLQEPVFQQQPMITIFDVKGRRRIGNIEHLATQLAESYPEAKVQVVGSDDLERMSFQKQVMLMAETAVLVTPPGGVAAMGVFLPPGSAIAVLNYIAVDDNSTLISVSMDVLQMARWEHVHIESIGVSLSDLALTGGEHGGPELGREACPSAEAAYIHCDYRLRDSTVDVLRDAVARGLDLWWLQRSERLPQELWGGPLGDEEGSDALISGGTWSISPLRALRSGFSGAFPRRAAAGSGGEGEMDRGGSNELRMGVVMTSL